jgi:hypothetical protein
MGISILGIFTIIGLIIMFSDQGGMGSKALLNERKDSDNPDE